VRDIERRAVLSTIELREAGGKRTLAGFAALYDSPSSDLGGFVEIIRPGAFSRAVREGQEVLARSEHDTRLLLGRRSNGTLRLFDDPKGLKYEVDVPDTQAGRDMATLVARGDVRGSSFAFTIPDPVGGQRWTVTEDGQALRELLDLDVFDVAPTANPAYPETTVSARALEQARDLTKPPVAEATPEPAPEPAAAEETPLEAQQEIDRIRLDLAG
jgi:HK97 family phage prohead protease